MKLRTLEKSTSDTDGQFNDILENDYYLPFNNSSDERLHRTPPAQSTEPTATLSVRSTVREHR